MAYAAFMRTPARRRGQRGDGGVVRTVSLPAPTRGWVTSQNLADHAKKTALVLDNWFPTQTGIRLRGGSPRYATLDASGSVPCESLFSYNGGAGSPTLFGTTDTKIFDITSVADKDTPPTPIVTGQTSGYYSTTNVTTSAASYLIAVNGDDALRAYDGTDMYPVTGTILYALDYDAETAAFTEGETLTGGTSGATSTIVKVIDNGTTGTLWINSLSGNYTNDETITDSATGSATANGTETALIGAITNVATSDLSAVSVYRNRLFFVEGGTMTVWYLPVDSVTGAASSFTLSGVFGKGGSVLMTGTWSMDSGDGLDDKFVVISTEGEVAVYEGSDPSDATDWRLVGRYDISPPMGKNCIMKAGGDLVIGTEEGVVPISEATRKDPAALSISAISRAIEPDWITAATQRQTLPWEVVKWPEKNMAIWTIPVTDDGDNPMCFVVNLETGAWCRYTGWNTRCIALHDGQVYFGSNDGRVKRAEIGGVDDEDTQYVSTYVGAFEHLGSLGTYKTVNNARAVFITKSDFVPQLSVSVNYTISTPAAPNAVVDSGSPGEWDVGLWDVARWDAGTSQYTTQTRWVSVAGSGMVIAPQLQITNGVSVTPTAELTIYDISYETGATVV